ncbi:hypothetical protein PsorP6_003550 [Peronosclerospora sorghi]|uniref:Uncharacterized protein n=1 Tax=Peronosclerospora sorghi TaxID=230839 RepID=A0ACC0VQ82_9STRA|nr:hypothetical protein PsorP6_003550 [Peronosclerospora sorghi]
MSLTSRAILVLGKVSVLSNVVTGAVMQGYKVSIGDLDLFLTHARTEYDEINAVVLGNELFFFVIRRKSGKKRTPVWQLGWEISVLAYVFRNFGFLQLVTMDFVDLFVRVLDPGAVSKARGHLEEKAASRASPDLSVELNLGTANIYACFDSFNTLIELVSTWTDQLVTEQKPRDTTAYVGLETGKESPSRVSVVTNLSPVLSSCLQPLGTVTKVGARGLDLSHTSGVRSDRRLVRRENDGAVNILEEIDSDEFGSGTKLFPGKTVTTDTEARLLRTPAGVVADDDPAYYCDSDSYSYCEKKFPDTACISVNNYGDVISKCTTNTAKRPACREENLSGGNDCW